MFKILDAKYAPANFHDVENANAHLINNQKEKLHLLLSQHELMFFDGMLGKWEGNPYHLELCKGAKPYHATLYSIPHAYKCTLCMEVNILCKVGILKYIYHSEWVDRTFIIPKKDKIVRFISYFRELYKRIKQRPYLIPKIQDLLLKLKGFQYATSLDLNMWYYHIKLTLESQRLCTIVLPWSKCKYEKLPMGLCNSADIFQEKMNELFAGLEST